MTQTTLGIVTASVRALYNPAHNANWYPRFHTAWTYLLGSEPTNEQEWLALKEQIEARNGGKVPETKSLLRAFEVVRERYNRKLKKHS